LCRSSSYYILGSAGTEERAAEGAMMHHLSNQQLWDVVLKLQCNRMWGHYHGHRVVLQARQRAKWRFVQAERSLKGFYGDAPDPLMRRILTSLRIGLQCRVTQHTFIGIPQNWKNDKIITVKYISIYVIILKPSWPLAIPLRPPRVPI
jgi:hypothetical protein